MCQRGQYNLKRMNLGILRLLSNDVIFALGTGTIATELVCMLVTPICSLQSKDNNFINNFAIKANLCLLSISILKVSDFTTAHYLIFVTLGVK